MEDGERETKQTTPKDRKALACWPTGLVTIGCVRAQEGNNMKGNGKWPKLEKAQGGKNVEEQCLIG